MNAPPLPMVYDDGKFTVAQGFRKIADRYYGAGEVVPLAPWEDRSDATHKHEFAFVRSAWKTLPEGLADLYPTADHLRKRALILAGYCTETLIDAGSNAAAIRVAAAMPAIDTFAWAVVRGSYVVIRRAESQSRRAMGKERFQASKTAILEIISDMLGVEPAALTSASGSPAVDRGAESRDEPPSSPKRARQAAGAGVG